MIPQAGIDGEIIRKKHQISHDFCVLVTTPPPNSVNSQIQFSVRNN